LYRIRGARVAELVEAGYETLLDLPRNFPATGPARRQLRSVRGARMIVARGLGRALAPIRVPTAFLDFETIAPAIPVWPGCRSYEPVPVQFSCHMVGPSGLEHYAWLAEGPDDPREALSDALIAACRDAKTIMAYNAPFERRGIAGLITAVPRFAAALAKLSRRLRDLLPVVRNHVYHPDFQGKFGIKEVLPVLVLGLGYDDLEIQDGAAASTALEALLLHGEQFAVSEKTELRRKLLRYCERDTLAMVRLHQRLRQLANAQ
jgi:hypothetical protein